MFWSRVRYLARMARRPSTRSPVISARSFAPLTPLTSATHVFCRSSRPESTFACGVGSHTSVVRPKHWPAKSPPKAGVWKVYERYGPLPSASAFAAASHAAVPSSVPRYLIVGVSAFDCACPNTLFTPARCSQRFACLCTFHASFGTLNATPPERVTSSPS